jgi:alpha-beta hydrolase superfamily lysophospholipase
MSYKNVTGYFQSEVDKINIFYRIWETKNYSAEKCIVVCHGYGEMSARYENLAEGLKNTGYSLFVMDLRGHGKSVISQKDLGVAPGLMSYVEDLKTFIDHIKKKHGVLKPVLLGHSFGALIVILYVLQPGWDKTIRLLIANGAPMQFILTLSVRIKKLLSSIISRFAPNFKIHLSLDSSYVSHDKEVVKNHAETVHDITTIKVGNEVLDKIPWCITQAANMRIPVLFTHGGADKISNPQGTIDFYNTCGSADKTLIVYEGFYHEIYNEVEKEKAFKDIIDWLEKRSRIK